VAQRRLNAKRHTSFGSVRRRPRGDQHRAGAIIFRFRSRHFSIQRPTGRRQVVRALPQPNAYGLLPILSLSLRLI